MQKSQILLARCKCGKNAKKVVWHTFTYYYCSACKIEVNTPKAPFNINDLAACELCHYVYGKIHNNAESLPTNTELADDNNKTLRDVFLSYSSLDEVLDPWIDFGHCTHCSSLNAFCKINIAKNKVEIYIKGKGWLG